MASSIRPTCVHESDCPVEGWEEGERGHVSWRTLLSGDRTPTHGLTMGVAEVEPDADRPLALHHHAQVEAYYVLSGAGEVTVDGDVHRVRAGSAVFIPGAAPHAARAIGSEPLRLLYVFASDAFEDVEYHFEG